MLESLNLRLPYESQPMTTKDREASHLQSCEWSLSKGDEEPSESLFYPSVYMINVERITFQVTVQCPPPGFM
jgi:hypothetical protein